MSFYSCRIAQPFFYFDDTRRADALAFATADTSGKIYLCPQPLINRNCSQWTSRYAISTGHAVSADFCNPSCNHLSHSLTVSRRSERATASFNRPSPECERHFPVRYDRFVSLCCACGMTDTRLKSFASSAALLRLHISQLHSSFSRKSSP